MLALISRCSAADLARQLDERFVGVIEIENVAGLAILNCAAVYSREISGPRHLPCIVSAEAAHHSAGVLVDAL